MAMVIGVSSLLGLRVRCRRSIVTGRGGKAWRIAGHVGPGSYRAANATKMAQGAA
jgi:hypothetical protein